MTDCAKWLNGRGVGARWDGTWSNSGQVHGNCSDFTGSYSSWTDQYRENLRKYVPYGFYRIFLLNLLQVLGGSSRDW